MIWSSLFLISVAQGLFLISLIVAKRSKNVLASWLIIGFLTTMVLTNFGYLVTRSFLRDYIPQFYALPFGMMFLFGPLFYFYTQAIVDPEFRWKPKYWLHFIPYLLQLAVNLPFFFISGDFWDRFITEFLSGQLPIRTQEKITFLIQDAHLVSYILITYRWLNKMTSSFGNAQFIITMSSRARWVRELGSCLLLFLITAVAAYAYIISVGRYDPVTNYAYTLVTSGIIYFMAYRMILQQELIVLDFSRKYKAYKAFDNASGDEYVLQITKLLEETKIFTNPNLKLADLADELKLPSHQLSKLINEKFGKSFNDLINEFRVKEFIGKVNHSDFRNHSIFGLALEVGFSTKSAFNSNFKKITGKNPSDYRLPQ